MSRAVMPFVSVTIACASETPGVRTPPTVVYAPNFRTSLRLSGFAMRVSSAIRSSGSRQGAGSAPPSNQRFTFDPGSRVLAARARATSASEKPPFERRLCRRNDFWGGGFGRGAKPPSEVLVSEREHPQHAALRHVGLRARERVQSPLHPLRVASCPPAILRHFDVPRAIEVIRPSLA